MRSFAITLAAAVAVVAAATPASAAAVPLKQSAASASQLTFHADARITQATGWRQDFALGGAIPPNAASVTVVSDWWQKRPTAIQVCADAACSTVLGQTSFKAYDGNLCGDDGKQPCKSPGRTPVTTPSLLVVPLDASKVAAAAASASAGAKGAVQLTVRCTGLLSPANKYVIIKDIRVHLKSKLEACLASCAGTVNHGFPHSCNQQLSCDMACRMRHAEAVSPEQCATTCERTRSSGCELRVGASAFKMCSACHKGAVTGWDASYDRDGTIVKECKAGCMFGEPAAEDFNPTNCPFNSKIPATCWGDSAYQRCPADRQGAYNAVMAKRPNQQAMHAVFAGLTSGKIPGCKVAKAATPAITTAATVAPAATTAAASPCAEAAAQQRQSLGELENTMKAVAESLRGMVANMAAADLEAGGLEDQVAMLEAAIAAEGC